MRTSTIIALIPAAACLLVGPVITGCSTAPKTDTERAALVDDAQAALDRMKKADPTLAEFVSKAHGYAIFPSVGKGGVGVGGAYGKGVVYEGGKLIGYCDLSQATIGLQLGGQAYSQLVCFETKSALDRFTGGNFEFSAQVSAVALKAGASAAADYRNGVAVFTASEAGLMYEASVGGQKFDFKPVSDVK